MEKIFTVRRTFSLLIVGLLGFIIFAGFLIHEQILRTLSDTKQQQNNKANRVAIRIEEKLHQSRERVEILALNPLLQEGNPRDIEDLLEKTMEQSPSCEALIVTEHDGSLIAEIPKGLHYYYINSNQLTSLLSKCEPLYIDITDTKKHCTFASAAQVQHSKGEGHIVIALLDLNYIAETTLLGNNDDKVSLFTENKDEIVLFAREHGLESHSVPIMVKILGSIVQRKIPAYLQGTAFLMPKLDWMVIVTRSYESFLTNNVKTIFRGVRFFTLLFLPVLIALVLTIFIINYSRNYLKGLALRDGLTNLYNHRYFQTKLHSLVNDEKKRKVSLLMIDLDDFKCFNDTYGHQAGDEVLKKVADIFLENIRDTDIASRYGGEEFAIILPGIGLEEAMKVAERIRKVIKTQCVSTVSIGVSSFPQPATTAEELIRGADNALYMAKDMSKNRVESVTESLYRFV